MRTRWPGSERARRPGAEARARRMAALAQARDQKRREHDEQHECDDRSRATDEVADQDRPEPELDPRERPDRPRRRSQAGGLRRPRPAGRQLRRTGEHERGTEQDRGDDADHLTIHVSRSTVSRSSRHPPTVRRRPSYPATTSIPRALPHAAAAPASASRRSSSCEGSWWNRTSVRAPRLGRQPDRVLDHAVAPVALQLELGRGVLRVVDQHVDARAQLHRAGRDARTNRRTVAGDR